MNKSQEYLAVIAKFQNITLPESGVEFKVRKANAFWFTQNISALPIGTGAEAHDATADAVRQATPEEITRNLQLTRKLICDHVLDPKIRDIPNYEAGEIGFDDLLPGDARFLIDYLMGIKDGQGQPVDTFPK